MAAVVLAITAQLSFAADASRLARRLEDGREAVII
jgi:hypothetical protein